MDLKTKPNVLVWCRNNRCDKRNVGDLRKVEASLQKRKHRTKRKIQKVVPPIMDVIKANAVSTVALSLMNRNHALHNQEASIVLNANIFDTKQEIEDRGTIEERSLQNI